MNSDIEFNNGNRGQKISTRIGLMFSALISMPKTLYFNFRALPFRKAIKFPILISYRTRITEIHRGIIDFSCQPYRFMVKVGFGGSVSIRSCKNNICFEGGHVIFGGKASFSEGIALRNSGELSFGDNFFANKNCIIWCSKKIDIGNNVLFGWNIIVRDSDGHLILRDGIPKPIDKEIRIGDHNWVCSECHLLKGTVTGDDCVIGYGSFLSKRIDANNVIIAGWPAKVVQENISWIRG